MREKTMGPASLKIEVDGPSITKERRRWAQNLKMTVMASQDDGADITRRWARHWHSWNNCVFSIAEGSLSSLFRTVSPSPLSGQLEKWLRYVKELTLGGLAALEEKKFNFQ